MHVLSLPPAFVLSQNQTLRLSSDPYAWHSKFNGIVVSPKSVQHRSRRTKIVVEKRFSVSSDGGLTHRRTPPPAFLFPIQQCQRAEPKPLAQPSPNRLGPSGPPRRGARCLRPPHFQVNRLSQVPLHFPQTSQENHPIPQNQPSNESQKLQSQPAAPQTKQPDKSSRPVQGSAVCKPRHSRSQPNP